MTYLNAREMYNPTFAYNEKVNITRLLLCKVQGCKNCKALSTRVRRKYYIIASETLSTTC